MRNFSSLVASLAIASAACLSSASGALITFSGETGAYNVAMDHNPYTATDGLPTGVTATFTGFNATDGQYVGYGHSSTDGGYRQGKMLWLADPDLANPGTGDGSIVFSQAVEVPSLWLNAGCFGGSVTVVGMLNGQPVAGFSYTNPLAYTNDASTFGTWTEMTVGAGKTIDSLVFSGGSLSAIDDMTVSVPEPTSLSLLGLGLCGVASTRRRRA